MRFRDAADGTAGKGTSEQHRFFWRSWYAAPLASPPSSPPPHTHTCTHACTHARGLRSAGKEVFAFTLNDARDLKRVLDVGVDAVVTNYPALALAAIGYRLTQCGSSSDL